MNTASKPPATNNTGVNKSKDKAGGGSSNNQMQNFSFNNLLSGSSTNASQKSSSGNNVKGNSINKSKTSQPKNNQSILAGLNNLSMTNLSSKPGANEMSNVKSMGPEPSTSSVSGPKSTGATNGTSVGTTAANNLSGNSIENIFMKMGNAISNNLERLKNTVSDKKKEAAEKEKAGAAAGQDAIYNLDESKLIIGENYMLIMGVAFAILLLILLYLLSKTFNVGRSLERIRMYELYQKITNYSVKKQGDTKLKDVTIASSYNSCHSGFQMFSYTSEEILKQIIKSGARYVELNIFPSKYGEGAVPVVSCGYKKGQWKLMLNTTTFETAVKTIAENAFKVADKAGGAPNPNDPFFLGLNLSTNNNISCLDLMTDILMDYLHDRMLDPKYAYQFNSEMHNTPISELSNKIVILSSSGFEGSKLEELINGKWQDETDPKNNANILLGIETFSVSALADEFKQDEKTAKLKQLSSRVAPTTSSGAANNIGKQSVAKSMMMNKNKNKKQVTPPGMQLDKAIESELLQKPEASDEEDENPESEENMADISDTGASSSDVYKALSGGDKKPGNIIRISAAVFNSPGFDGERIKRHNEKGLTIVVPHVEGDILSYNYNTDRAFELGCQFVAMDYQTVDEPMDAYITKFEKKAIIPFKAA